ncbi:hypothetical protein DSAG12_03792 [Promethearchaeum syntrophicum]|uniref:Uncharacterized protein n=1 Tax=Promethearchaeum syntrophicum TaxID=2594042 RepID=A0A5B9DFQ0_9ARCH|nr:hypothetical protein [Candidatus Prometheoarchaeum syntrophicum]QEE17954.1 hypothetical protein DSAG12_03792 [Candidatus Prometheoarchaeum syntrophicum]
MSKSIKSQQNGQENTIGKFYQDIETNGLKYIQKQKQYLILTAIFPIYAIIIQIFNLFAILNRIPLPPPNQPGIPVLEPRSLYEILTPVIIFLVISSFALLKFIFLCIWKKKVHQYEHYKGLIKSEEISDVNKKNTPSITLTQLFYDIVAHMQRVRVIFILLNIVFILYIQWSIGFLLTFFGVTTNPNPPPVDIFHLLNAIGEFGLIFYMLFEWIHFTKWNRKIRNLVKFEKKIYNEIEGVNGLDVDDRTIT